jgi:hypothetical protein
MKVSSPVGDFPFQVTRLRVRSDGLHLEGSMGAWPSRVVIGPSDLPALARVLAPPLAAAVAGIAVSRSLYRLGRRGSDQPSRR